VETNFWKTLTAYQAAFTNWNGELYESELVRSAIDAIARNTAKLKVEFSGSAKNKLKTILKNRPNDFQSWYQFLYRTVTILEMQNNAFIVPIFDEYDDIVGIFPVLPSSCELVESKGTVFLRYRFSNGEIGIIEYALCGLLTKFQYQNDFFGSTNSALKGTMGLIDLNKQGIKEAIKNSATFRFMAQYGNFAEDEDLAKERKRFMKENFESESGGLLLFPSTYKEIKQIDSKAFTIDDKQLNLIKTNVFNYFGVNEDLLQNKLVGDAASAFYEGKVEPFAIQFSEVLTRMIYSPIERNTGNSISLTANRVQFMTNRDKLNVSAQMADRGIMSINELREIWNLEPVEGGDRFIARGEYYFLDEGKENDNANQE
jgi:HK97 family phage portal protein